MQLIQRRLCRQAGGGEFQPVSQIERSRMIGAEVWHLISTAMSTIIFRTAAWMRFEPMTAQHLLFAIRPTLRVLA